MARLQRLFAGSSDGTVEGPGTLHWAVLPFMIGALTFVWTTVGLPRAAQHWIPPRYWGNLPLNVALVLVPATLSFSSLLLIKPRGAKSMSSKDRFEFFKRTMHVWFLGGCTSGIISSIYGLHASHLSPALYEVVGAAYVIVALASIWSLAKRPPAN